MKKLALAFLFLCQMAFGQAFINETALRSDGRPAANAQIRICTTTVTNADNSPTTSEPACTPLAPIFKDKDITLVKDNPFNADAQGNYSYGIAPGFYKEQIIYSGVIFTTVRQAPTSTGTGGIIVGTGDIASAPAATQTITQPTGTSLIVNSLQKVIYVDPSFNWSQNPSDDLTTAGSNSITLTPCPKGLSGTNLDHYVYISGTGTAEAVKITGGTCTSGSTSGTITVITSNPHSTGWSVKSSTDGYKEASEYGKFSPTSPSGSPQGGVIRGLPGTEYNFTAPLYIESAQQIVDGNNSIFQCNTAPCVFVGSPSSSLSFSNIHLINIRLRAMVSHAGGIEDNSQGATIVGLKFRNSASGAYFDYLIQNDNNQAEHVYDVDPSTASNWGQCTVEPCSVVFKGTGGSNAGIIYVHHSNLTLGCQGNGFDWKNANTLFVDDTTLQGYSQWAGRVVGAAAQPTVSLNGVYHEVGSCTNPNGTGTAGWIVQNGNINLQNVTGLNGKYPTITASSPGATSLVYYLVAKSSTLGTGTPRAIGKCLTSGTGTCTVKWFPIGTTGTITYDLLRVVSDMSSDKPAPNGTGNYSVATGLTVAGSCVGNTCTAVDDTTVAAASYTVATPTYFPVIAQWPSSIDLGPNADTSNVNNGGGRLNADVISGNSSVPGILTAVGALYPTVFANHCDSYIFGTALLPQCNQLSTGNNALAQSPQIYNFGGVTGTSNGDDIKGRTIYIAPGGLGHTDMVTWFDSTPGLTTATPSGRPVASVNDTATGPANTTSQTPANTRWGFRTPLSFDFYFGSLFNGTSWFHRFSSTSFATKTPIEFDGSTSGLAQIGVAAIAGTPNKLLLPTATGSNGNCLTTDGANPQQTSWIACGAVTSVFGRTGVVTATSGDYTEAQISFTDITTNNASSTKHGYLPKLPNDASKCFLGDGTYATCPGAIGSGITTFNGLTAGTQSVAFVNTDPYITLSVSSVTATHTFNAVLGGVFTKALQHAQTVYKDAANTWSTGAQDFGAAISLKIPTSPGLAPTANGLIGYDSTANVYKFGANGSTKFMATIDGNIATATALLANGANCTGIQFPKGVDALGVAEGCVSLADADLPDTLTAINYLLLAGGTMTGQLVASNLGVAYTASDTNPSCGTGIYTTFADASEHKLKKCQDGVATDLDTSGAISVPGANTQCLFNDGGGLGADPGCVFDKTTDTLTVAFLQTTGTGPDDFTEQAAPTSPATGHISVWADSSDHRIHDKRATGTVGTTVVSDTGATNNFLNGIGLDGVITKAQVNFSNLGGTASDGQIPDNIHINTADTATALVSNPSNCGAGTLPRGVDATGVGEGCGAVNLATETSGNLGVSHLNSGTSASGSTFWRGDGTWAAPAGGGDFTGPGSSVDGNVVGFSGTTGKLGQDSGVPFINLVTAASSYTSGNLVKAAASDKTTSDSGIAAANVVTAASNYTSGELVQAAAANKTTSSSGIATANVVTAGSNFVSGQLVQGAGANKTSSDSGIVAANVITSGSTMTSNLPIFGNGTKTVATGTVTGNTTKVATSTGSLTSANVASWDANGNVIDAGVAVANIVTPSSSTIKTNLTLDCEGTGNTCTVPIKVWLPAAGCSNTTAGTLWDLPTSTPAVAACVTGTNTQKGVLQYADTSGGFSAQNTLILPADFSGNIDARIIWRTSATTGNAKFSFSTICTDVAASATDDPSFNTASTVTTAAPGTANRVQTSSITSVTATGCTAGNLLHVKLFRDGNDGSDTIGASLDVIGVELTIRRAI